MRFIIVRHAETEHNKEGTITGQTDVGLGEEGRRQAEIVADRLKEQRFDAFYSSDLERSSKTVEAIASRHGTAVDLREAFRERNYGVYEGEPKEKWSSVVSSHTGDTFTLRPDGGESMKEVADRYIDGIKDIWREHGREGRVLIGGHAVAIRATLMRVLGATTPRAYEAFHLDNTGITELGYRNRTWTIHRVNDTAHLA